jgi:hypothetical protein
MRIIGTLSAFGFAAISLQSLCAAEEFPPSPLSIERYEHIWKSAPFVVATEVVKGPEPLSARFAVTGFAIIAGEPVAFLLDRTQLKSFPISKSKPNGDVQIVAINSPSDVRDLRVTIRAGADTGDLKYDPAAIPDQGNRTAVAANVMPVPATAAAPAPSEPAVSPPPPEMESAANAATRSPLRTRILRTKKIGPN